MENCIVFNDRSKLNYLSAYEEYKPIKGVSRSCLTISFDSSIGIDKVFSIFKNHSCLKDITLKECDLQREQVYSDYILLDTILLKEEVMYVTVGQVSYSEKLMQEQKEQLDSMSEVISDILGGAL